MKDSPIYVAGQFQKTDTPLKVINPYNGNVIGTTYQAGETEFEAATKAAENVRMEMQNLPTYTRYEILRQISDELKKKREELGMILALECGKPLKYSIGEIDRAVQTFLTAAEESKRLPGEVISMDWIPGTAGKKCIVEHFPVGLVAGIAPFNFPMNLVAHKVAPAIAAGCPIVLKPASATPLSALKLAEIIDKTALPKGAVSVMPMNRETGNKLVTDDRYALLSFTGSPHVGWEMKKNCGKKKVVLELGGNAGAVVTPTAEIDHAVKRCVIGAFSNNGQSCISTQRIYVHEKNSAEFFQKFTAAVKKLTIGAPDRLETDVASMIDQKNAERIEAWVDEAVASGAKVLTGGKRDGTIYKPTVITNTNVNMKVCSLEAFGPIVVLETYDDFSAVISAVNNSDFGLQAGIFTTNYDEIKYAFKHLHVGGVVINDVPTFRADQQPYGGIKDSGIGREGPKYAIADMMEPRVLILDDR